LALNTYLDITTTDAQGYQNTLTFRIKPLALAAAQTLPSAAAIAAVIDSIFAAADTPSMNKVLSYDVRVHEDNPSSSGGDGNAPTSEAVVPRNSINDIPGEWIFRIPGLNKAAVTFDPINPSSVSTSGTMWDDIRDALTDALIAVSNPSGAYGALNANQLAEVAQAVDGRRAPMRPR
jgi:hypothetical protein